MWGCPLCEPGVLCGHVSAGCQEEGGPSWSLEEVEEGRAPGQEEGALAWYAYGGLGAQAHQWGKSASLGLGRGWQMGRYLW